MKVLKHLTRGSLFFILLIVFLLFGCKRDIPPLPSEGLRNITFRLSGFEAETTPLDGPYATSRLALGSPDRGTYALQGIEPSLEPQYLYFWSFNNEDLEPDVAVDEAGAGITFEAAAEEPTFPNSTFAVDPYGGGKAFSLRGGQMVELELPMRGVKSISEFAFDISSSGTGPKAFSLFYSVDGGTTYSPLVESKQFDDMGDQRRNPYQFDLAEVSAELTDNLVLKFDFFAGDRGGAGDYNESQGTVRLDNIRLSGVYNATSGNPTTPSTLHYYIFSADDGNVVQQQQLPMDALGDGGTLDVKLADGNYDVLFVAYRSDKGMLLPEDLTNASDFYLGQHFDDYRAAAYTALLENIVVGEDHVEAAAMLSRCYSLVEFDFMDSETNLQRVKKIEIVRLHDNFLYTPFGIPTSAEDSGAQRIEFGDFNNIEDYKISLHQFFGLLDEGGRINYELIAYGEGDVVLNTVSITEVLKNNVRLRLSGKLLGDAGAINGFSVALDTDWREILEHGF